MSESFPNKEKLKSQKLIERLFQEGDSVSVYPLRLVYLKEQHTNEVVFKAGVSVSKKNFKKAVDRNRIKRLLREAYRLNKSKYFNNITTPFAFMILYIGKDGPEIAPMNSAMNQLLKKFSNKVAQE